MSFNFRPAGEGKRDDTRFICLGCGQPQPTKGSKGAPGALNRRCAGCVAAKAARAAA